MNDRCKSLGTGIRLWAVFPTESASAETLNTARKTLRADIRGIPFDLTKTQVVDATNVDQLLESKLGIVPEHSGNVSEIACSHLQRQFAKCLANLVSTFETMM